MAERTFGASAVIFDKYLFTGSGFSDYGSVLSNIYWRSSIPHVESWCFGLPAEGEPSIAFIVDFNRTFSNFNSEEHITKQIVEVTILNCKVGSPFYTLIDIYYQLTALRTCPKLT